MLIYQVCTHNHSNCCMSTDYYLCDTVIFYVIMMSRALSLLFCNLLRSHKLKCYKVNTKIISFAYCHTSRPFQKTQTIVFRLSWQVCSTPVWSNRKDILSPWHDDRAWFFNGFQNCKEPSQGILHFFLRGWWAHLLWSTWALFPSFSPSPVCRKSSSGRLWFPLFPFDDPKSRIKISFAHRL